MAMMIAEIIISLFAVFGLYAAVRLLCGVLLSPRELAHAILIERELDEDETVVLVFRAREGSFDGKRRLVALLPAALAESDMAKTLLALGVECYQIDDEKGG